jgi:hypothetical protein
MWLSQAAFPASSAQVAPVVKFLFCSFQGPELGAALEISLRKKYVQTLFFSVQTCRYGESYEISSRQISNKVIFLRSMCVAGKNCVFG